MLLNEILYLLSGCMAILLVSLIYLKYRERKLREALNYHVRQICKEILVLNDFLIELENNRRLKKRFKNEINLSEKSLLIKFEKNFKKTI